MVKMDYSVNRRLLLQETDSESDIQNDITEPIQSSSDQPILTPDTKLFFKSYEPQDKYYTCYFIFYLLGITTLLPWNFFITADDYWMYKFRNVNNDNITHLAVTPANRTPLQKEFTSYLSIASAVPNTIFLILSTFINRMVSLQLRMVGSLIIIIAFFIVTTVFVTVNTDKWQQQFFFITMATVVILNVAGAILSGSIFGIVGKFTPAYISAVISGQALGGIFTALVQVISLATGESSLHSAFLYFMIGNGIVGLTVFSYLILSKSTFFQYHIAERHPEAETSSIQAELQRTSRISYGGILNKICVYGISEWLVFVVTLSIYPGVTVLIESQNKGNGDKWSDVYFVPVVSYLVFSTGDYIGRIAAGYFQWPRQKGLLILALNFCRLGFIPLLLLCNAQPRHHLPVLIRLDAYYVIIMCLFSLSNGYLANIAVICAPRLVDHHEKEVASSMMAAFLGIGLSMGSVLSLLMVNLL